MTMSPSICTLAGFLLFAVAVLLLPAADDDDDEEEDDVFFVAGLWFGLMPLR